MYHHPLNSAMYLLIYLYFLYLHSTGNNELVFINFYADWCRFSNILAPTWDETADKVKELFPDEGRVVIGKVDCDAECKYACTGTALLCTNE